MNDYHRRLANTPRFREAATTMGIKSLARQYGVGREAIRDMLQLIGVEPVTLTAPNDDAPTPEEAAMDSELRWAIRKAVWKAARNTNGIHEPWRYAYVRNMLLDNKMQVDEFCQRYGKYRASLYHFQKRIHKQVRLALEEQGFQP